MGSGCSKCGNKFHQFNKGVFEFNIFRESFFIPLCDMPGDNNF
jgi:hypothetical protein